MNKEWKLGLREPIYDGFYKVSRCHFTHTLFAGGWSQTIDRELLERGNVAAVLPYDPKLDRVVLVEQFRIGAMNDQDPWLTEVIAGMIEPGESPEEMVIREAEEEAGLKLEKLIPVSRYFSSPGSSTEEVFLYAALTDLSEAGGLHGLAEEGEDIRVINIPAEEATTRFIAGELRNALTVIAMQWFMAHRDELRS